jgi:hypothetical protein
MEAVERGLHVVDGKPKIYLFVDDDNPPKHGEVGLVGRENEMHAGRCDASVLAWEIEGYRMRETPDGRPIKDEPHKVNDHAADALRYLIMGTQDKYGGPPMLNLPPQEPGPWSRRGPNPWR